MLPLTADELQEFEDLCDAEDMSLSEREGVIKEAFGPAAAAAYINSRGGILAFGSGLRSKSVIGLLRRSSRNRRRRMPYFRGGGRK